METRKSHFLRTCSCRPFAFGTQYERTRHPVIDFVVSLRAALVETDGPDILLFQFFQGASDVGHTRNRQMLACPSRSFCNCARDSHSTPFRNDDAIGPGAIGCAYDCAQIVRIFHPIEQENERPFAALIGEDFVHVRILLSGCNGDHALMRRTRREPIQLLARKLANGDA